jgi:hypothetical protein
MQTLTQLRQALLKEKFVKRAEVYGDTLYIYDQYMRKIELSIKRSGSPAVQLSRSFCPDDTCEVRNKKDNTNPSSVLVVKLKFNTYYSRGGLKDEKILELADPNMDLMKEIKKTFLKMGLVAMLVNNSYKFSHEIMAKLYKTVRSEANDKLRKNLDSYLKDLR